jgi:hypothetical protein
MLQNGGSLSHPDYHGPQACEESVTGDEEKMANFERELERLSGRLVAINRQLDRLAKREETAAWVGGRGSNGEFFTEKERLIKETDAIFDRADELLGIDTKTDPQ